MHIENEYRVRPVTRYIVTHFQDNLETGVGAASVAYGEFPNIDQADTVGRALSAANPGSTFVTIEERRKPVAIFYAYTHEQAHKMMEACSQTDAVIEAQTQV
jgi:hypothetical protein